MVLSSLRKPGDKRHMRFSLLRLGALVFLPFWAAPALAQSSPEPSVDDVTSVFVKTYATTCSTLMDETENLTPARYTLHFRYDFDDPADPEQTLTLYAFDCFQGAYNFGAVFFSVNQYGEITPLSFAFPELDVTHADPEDFESAVTGISVTGFYAEQVVMAADVDEKASTIHHFAKWRGLGDAYEYGTWKLRNGRFVLQEFGVDAAYDGKQDAVIVYPRAN